MERSIRKVLVANRGEIALRVMRACRELEIETVAIYGAGEETALHVAYADDAYRLPDGPGISYLDIDAIVAIAIRAGADAIHPGYGFLSEKAAFAEAVDAAGLIFIGPSATTIAAMGDKVEARKLAIAAGVRPVPGTEDPVESVDAALAWAEHHGYPVAVKAAGGGGGRGFRVARSADEIAAAYEGSRGEAERYFANPTVYLERYLERPRHIEVQVFGDSHGNVVAFPERDCSIQRRHQKLVEESPSPAVTPAIRAALQDATVKLAASVGYVGAGTLEYLLDADGSFYFLEMNTRIQVEHTVTELITGVDLVAEQIRVAMGQPLSFEPGIVATGWAIECRINAEDSGAGFAPTPGTIGEYREPSGFGVRVDSGFGPGGTVLPTYDSLISKLVVWGRDRDETLRRARRALADYTIGGIETTIPFHARVLHHPAFIGGDAATTFLQEFPEVLSGERGQAAPVVPDEATTTDLLVEVNGRRFDVKVRGAAFQAGANANHVDRTRRPRSTRASGPATSGNDLVSSVQGTVVRVAVTEGQEVAAGDLVCVIEAMKMENEIVAHRPGRIQTLSVQPGASISAGATIATVSE